MGNKLETTSSNQEGLNKSLLKQLECPVCLEICTPPIRMCVRSHIVCSKCAKNLESCGICRQPMAAERSWFAEEICSKVKLPCIHVTNGCNETFDLSKLKAHLPDCAFKSYDCLIGGYFDNGVWKNVCKWNGPELQLRNHVEETHVPTKDYFIKVNEQRYIKFDSKPSIQLTSAYDSLFWIITCFWGPNREIEIFVLFIGSKDKSAKFQYKFDFGKENGNNLSFHSHIVPCSLDERVDKTLKLGNDILSLLKAPDKTIPYKVNILEK